MAHNLATNADGSASMFSVREVPWHKLGKILGDYPSIKEALKAGGLDFNVEFGTLYDEFGEAIPTDIARSVYRTDTKVCLGTVGDRYHLIQNRDGFDTLESLMGSDLLLETGGALGRGEQVFIVARVPEDMKIGGETYRGYLVVMLYHNGRGGMKVLLTPIRVVCQNTANLALALADRIYTIRHTKTWEQKIAVARQVLGLSKNYFKNFLEVAEDLVRQKYEEHQFFSLMDQLFEKPDDETSKKGATLYEQQRDTIIDCYNAEDLNNIRDTKWGAYNAIADYADHHRDSRGENKDDNEYLRTFTNTALKDQAFALLTAK